MQLVENRTPPLYIGKESTDDIDRWTGWLLWLRRLANREICPIFTLHSQYMQYKDAIGNILGLDEIYFFPLTRIPLSLAFGQDKWFFLCTCTDLEIFALLSDEKNGKVIYLYIIKKKRWHYRPRLSRRSRTLFRELVKSRVSIVDFCSILDHKYSV
jgi:hypothetical protein